MKIMTDAKSLVESFLEKDENFVKATLSENMIAIDFQDINKNDYHETLYPYIVNQVDCKVSFKYGAGHRFLLFVRCF
jgi:hypothetical protein